MKIKYIAASLLVLASLIGATAANAHYLWIEQPAAGNAIIHFGEFDEGLIERSPGRMDEMPSIDAFSGGVALTVTKLPDHFALSARYSANAPVTAQELGDPVKDWRASGNGIVKPMFYARYAVVGDAPTARLDLDIVPASDGKSVQVWFHGKPLTGATVNLFAPNGWAKTDKTGADGKLAMTLPWRGYYVAEVIYREAVTGSFRGADYEAVRHRATLTLDQPNGPATFRIMPHDHEK
ncbi:hypothetical protein [Sphingomonas sp.]|uniref:hypothetical protein n=1 Tax=Sphingomonas sp. TaxID=28214 RepID=UPI00307FC6CD